MPTEQIFIVIFVHGTPDWTNNKSETKFSNTHECHCLIVSAVFHHHSSRASVDILSFFFNWYFVGQKYCWQSNHRHVKNTVFFSAMSRFRSFEFNKYNNNKRKLKLNREYEKLSLKHWFQFYVWLYHRYMWRQSYQHCISTVNDRTANRWERKPNKTEKKPEKKSVLKISWKDQLIIHTKPNTLFLIIFLTFIFFVFFSLNLYVMS